MKKVVAFTGSPRKNGNSTIMLQRFVDGANESDADCKVYNANEINLNPCLGCLNCNVTQHCTQKNDDWTKIANDILQSDIIVFSSPVYFHHLTSTLKKLIDRFRSFIKVQITPEGLIEKPWQMWSKHFVVILTLGSSNNDDAQPVIEMFEFMKRILGQTNHLHVFTANRCVIGSQIIKEPEKTAILYQKLGLPPEFAYEDYAKNQKILADIFELGKELTL